MLPPRLASRLLTLLPLAFLPALRAAPEAAAPAAPDAIEQAWSDATLYLFKESYLGFKGADSREARLGQAALLVVQQPKTDGNLDQAERELASLAGVAVPDEIAATARYLLGRLAHIHRATPDLATAAAHYRHLIGEHPGHLLADLALVKLALIEIHDLALTPERRLALFDAYTERADALARPESRRELHLFLAEAARQYELGDERMLRHLLAADAAGLPFATLRANVTVSIGELASRLGRADLARTYFERYLAEFQRDYRRALVKDKLAALSPAAASPAPEARASVSATPAAR